MLGCAIAIKGAETGYARLMMKIAVLLCGTNGNSRALARLLKSRAFSLTLGFRAIAEWAMPDPLSAHKLNFVHGLAPSARSLRDPAAKAGFQKISFSAAAASGIQFSCSQIFQLE